MSLNSRSVNTPIWASIRAWAIDPRMSWRYNRRSNPTDAENFSMSEFVAPENRPPHAFFWALFRAFFFGVFLDVFLIHIVSGFSAFRRG